MIFSHLGLPRGSLLLLCKIITWSWAVTQAVWGAWALRRFLSGARASGSPSLRALGGSPEVSAIVSPSGAPGAVYRYVIYLDMICYALPCYGVLYDMLFSYVMY